MINKKTIGVITRHLDGSLFGSLMYFINEKASSKGYRIVALKTPQSVSQFTLPLATNVAAGWLVIQEPLHESFFGELQRAGVPVVGLNHESSRYPFVQFDNRGGMAQSVHHLVEHGHRRIAFMGNLQYSNTKERFAGYQEALKKEGLEYDPELVVDIGDFAQFGGSATAEKFIKGELRATAIAASGDFSTIGFIDRVKAAGYRVPEDIALTGFDDIPLTDKTIPSITSVKVPLERMAEQALSMLLDMIENGAQQPENQRIKTELVVRRSCGCQRVDVSEQEYDEDFLKAFNRISEVLDVNRQFLAHLAAGDMNKIKSLSWLRALRCPWGSFGQWTKDESGEQIITIRQQFLEDFAGEPVYLMEGQQYQLSDFPVIEHIPETALQDRHHVVTLCPISANGREWGILTLVQPIDKSLMYFKSNTITYTFGLIANALERAELFEQIQDFNERLEIVSETATDGIFMWNIATGTIDWNHSARRILGSSLTHTQDDLFEMIHPLDRPGMELAWRSHNEFNKPFRLEYRLKGEGGDYIWVEASGKAIRDNDNNPYRMIGSIRDISERKRAESQIHFMAYHDMLTGLPNRAMFYNQLSQALQLDKPFSIILVDLDGFKLINDNYGHQTGDELLKHFAGHLTGAVSPGDLAARLGGDEFIVLMNDVNNVHQVYDLCEAILSNMREPFLHYEHEIHISGSMGISLYPKDGLNPDMLIKNADTAMYEAKSSGKNQYKAFSGVKAGLTLYDEYEKS